VLGEPEVCQGLRAIARLGAALRVVVGTDIWRPPVPREIRGLPELTARYVDQTLAGRLAGHGWKVTGFGELSPDEVASTWARRLAAGRPARPFVLLRAEAVEAHTAGM
jgi:16S rRNA (adenine(1408)-N(1))-methyltransferase